MSMNHDETESLTRASCNSKNLTDILDTKQSLLSAPEERLKFSLSTQ